MKKALYITPTAYEHSQSGSANRMQQTARLLGEAKYEIDFLNMADLGISVSRKSHSYKKRQLPIGYDLYFFNYTFTAELFSPAKTGRAFIDIHDDLIERDRKLNANWFTRTFEEVRSVFTEHSATAIHIAKNEYDFYEKNQIAKRSVFLPYVVDPQKITLYNLRQKKDFGFIGTQNSVNAQSVLALRNHIETHQQKATVLIAGKIADGIKSKPTFYFLQRDISLEEFYSQIKAALVLIKTQTGASTKIVEAMSFGVPVIAYEHSFRNIGFDTRPSFPGLYEYTRGKWGREFLAELAQTQQIEYLKWIDNCHVERTKLVQTLI